MTNVVFITGNENKAKYLSRLIGMEIDNHKLDLDEIQSVDPKEVVEHKVRQAYDILKQPVLVEDSCMGIDELGGLPGPFIKFFVDQENGNEKICRMTDGLDSRRATATTTFGYYDGKEVRFFQGTIHGEIPDNPGEEINGFGWDAAFIPDGYGGTIRSELSREDYDKSYMEVKPIDQVREFLTSLQ